MPRRSTTRYTAGKVFAAPYLLDNDVPIEEQMKQKPRDFVVKVKEYIPGSTHASVCYLDPAEHKPSEGEQPLLYYPVAYLKDVDSETYFTNTMKWNDLGFNEQMAASAAVDTAHPMDIDTDTNTDIVNARTKRPRDDGDDDSDAQRPSMRQKVRHKASAVYSTVAAWLHKPCNTTNAPAQVASPAPVAPSRLVSRSFSNPVVCIQRTPAPPALGSPAPAQGVSSPAQGVSSPASPQPTQSTINVTNTSALPVKECFYCVWLGLLAFGWLCGTIFLHGMLRTWSEFEDDDLSTVCCVIFTLLVLTVLPLWIQYKSEYALVIKLVMVCLTLLVHAVFFTPRMN